MPEYFIETADDELRYERCESFGGGMDAYTRSTLLPADAYQYGLNVLVNDNFEPRTRAGADSLGTIPVGVSILLTEASQPILQEAGGHLLLEGSSGATGKVQGLFYFDTPTIEQLIAGEGDKLFYWDGGGWTEMSGWTLTDATLSFSADQGVDKVLFADGTDLRIWNGTSFEAAFADAANTPKGANIVLWHAGRMWATGFTGGTLGKEDDAIWASALLSFGNGDWDAANRNFRVGGGEGDPITGLASLSSSADKGFVMAVLKQNSIWLVNTDPTATIAQYSASIGPEQVTDGIGCVGKRAFCVYGNDLLFVSPDKSIRSLARMEAAASQYQLSPPLSLPIQPYVDRINWNFANTIAVKKYRELALFAVPLDAATSPNTVFVWNGRLQKWVGIWTGWTPHCWEVTRFSGVNRLVFGDDAGNVNQWKDFQDSTDDATYTDNGASIESELWIRSLLFGEALNDKEARHAETRFSASNAVVNVTMIADNVEIKNWSVNVTQAGLSLPIPQLPFDLTGPSNVVKRKGLLGTAPFNEVYLKINSTSGWWNLKTVSMSAFVNTLEVA